MGCKQVPNLPIQAGQVLGLVRVVPSRICFEIRMLSRIRQTTLTDLSFAYDSNNHKMETIVDVCYEMRHYNSSGQKKRKSKVMIDIVVFRGSSGLKRKLKV